MTDLSNLEFDHNTICYHGIQRVFRNAMIAYVRVRMMSVFGTEHLQRLRAPFRNDWEELKRKSDLSRQIGGTETHLEDEYDLLDVGHLFNIFDVHFDKLFSTAAIEGTPHTRPVKTKLLGNLKQIKDSRDPNSHPVTEEVSYEEAVAVLTDCRQVLMWLGLSEVARELLTIIKSLPVPGSSYKEELEAENEAVLNLPTEDSIYYDFIGRQEALTALSDWFSQKQNKRCLLAGDGGKGKSAIAYRFALELSVQARDQYRLVTWVSAKQRRFQDGRTIATEAADFSDLESAIDKLLMHYGMPQPEEILSRKKETLLGLLNTYPAFIVVDDIDTVLTDDEVVGFFTFEVPETNSSVLLTSRRTIPGIRSFSVKGFDLKEATNFIASRIGLYDLDPGCCPPQIAQDVIQATDGSPLYMDDLLRLAKMINLPKAISSWKDKQGDEARRYALQRELDGLSPDSRKVLIAACISEQPISFEEIISVLSISEERVMTALSQLQDLFLFPKPRIVEGEQRFSLNSNTRKLVRLIEGSSDQYQRVEMASRAVTGKMPSVGRSEISPIIRQAHLQIAAGKMVEVESLLLSARERYVHNADIEGFLGFLYRRWGRLTDARRHFQEAFKLKSKNRETYRHWVRMEMSEREWMSAIAVADNAMKMIPEFYEMLTMRAEARVRSGLDHQRRLQKEKAYRLWSDCVIDLEHKIKDPDKLGPGERQLNRILFKSMVISLECMGEFRKLRDWFLRWEKEHPDDENVLKHKQAIEDRRKMSIEQLAQLRPTMQTTSRPRPFQ